MEKSKLNRWETNNCGQFASVNVRQNNTQVSMKLSNNTNTQKTGSLYFWMSQSIVATETVEAKTLDKNTITQLANSVRPCVFFLFVLARMT